MLCRYSGGRIQTDSDHRRSATQSYMTALEVGLRFLVHSMLSTCSYYLSHSRGEFLLNFICLLSLQVEVQDVVQGHVVTRLWKLGALQKALRYVVRLL